jgi:hypothetical protein
VELEMGEAEGERVVGEKITALCEGVALAVSEGCAEMGLRRKASSANTMM